MIVRMRIFFTALSIAAIIYITYFFHGILKSDRIFTHFYYVPIVLSSIWFKKKGIAVTAFLSLVLVLSNIFFLRDPENWDNYIRAVIFIIISAIISRLSEKKTRAESAIFVLRQQEIELRKTSDTKEAVLQEIKSRMQNNLQVVYSLLNLQSSLLSDEPAVKAINESKDRVKSMAIIQEMLIQNQDINTVNLNEYLKELLGYIFKSYKKEGKNITLNTNIMSCIMDVEKAISLGFIINELVTNSLKYAFSGMEKGEIYVRVINEENAMIIVVEDNGIGLPGDYEARKNISMGIKLVSTLVMQLNGTMNVEGQNGARFTIEFPASCA